MSECVSLGELVCYFDATAMKALDTKLDRILALLEKRTPKRDGREFDEAKYTDDFLSIWKVYPKRAGANPKLPAYRAFNARKKAGVTATKMHFGVLNYAAFCEATGKLNTEYVMTAARFFGPGREWENDWLPPEPKTEQPKTDEEWLALAAKKGVQARQGESWPSFKARIMEA